MSDDSFLIVCSDERSLDLARVLCERGGVYRRWATGGSWQYSVFRSGKWSAVEPAATATTPTDQLERVSRTDEVPAKFVATFVHVGRGDLKGIPDDRKLGKVFAFSGGGLTEESDIGRADVEPICRPFRVHASPVRSRHLDDLLAFARGTTDRRPPFCEPDKAFPALTALAILCQGYVSSGVAAGRIARSDPLAVRIGWAGLSDHAQKALGDKLQSYYEQMAGAEWWRQALGDTEQDHSAYVDFLRQLGREAKNDGSDALSEQSADELIGELAADPKLKAIGVLLKARTITDVIVADAYDAIGRQLELL